MINLLPYTPEIKQQWDGFIHSSRNSTLLHLRDYMDYHSDRFQDASVVFTDSRNKIIAVMPANIDNADKRQIISHQGLTYGGLVVSPDTHADTIGEIYSSVIDYYRHKFKTEELIVKPIPQIYSSMPCEEELYFIHRLYGKLIRRNLSQAICLDTPHKKNSLRRRCVNKAIKAGLSVVEATDRLHWNDFHGILSEVLSKRHGVAPVHTADELWRLHSLFPGNIKLYIATLDNDIQAGSIVYYSKNVAHTQYLASSDHGCEHGALDLVINHIMQSLETTTCKYLDFGISNESDGSLNYGLALQKEGFGARGVCYDTYSLKL